MHRPRSSGFGYLWRGMRLVYFEHPETWRLWLTPILLTGLVLVAAIVLVAVYADNVAGFLWDRPAGWWMLVWVPYAIVVGLLVAGAALMGVVVASLLITAPFNDALSRRVEELARGRPAPETTWREDLVDVFHAVVLEARKLAVYILLWIPMLALGAVPLVGQVLALALAWIVTIGFLAFDYMDWPASRRRWRFDRRFALLRDHAATTLSFGAATWLVLLVPVLNLFLIPSAVAGGTLMFLDLAGE